MSQTLRQRRYSPLAMRWLHAGSDPSRSDHGHHRAQPPLMRFELSPRSPLAARDLASTSICRSHPACVTSTIEVGAGIKCP